MTKWLGIIILAPTLLLGAAATIRPAVAASIDTERHAERARDVRAQRHHGYGDRFVYRPEDQPRCYDRPVSYSPAPFVPLLFGYGWEPR